MGHLDYPTDADEVQCYQYFIAPWMHGLAEEEVAMCGNVHFAEEEVAMCLAWIGFHEDSGSNCAKSLLGASFNFSQRQWPFARTRECIDGGRKLRGIFWRLGGNWRE